MTSPGRIVSSSHLHRDHRIEIGSGARGKVPRNQADYAEQTRGDAGDQRRELGVTDEIDQARGEGGTDAGGDGQSDPAADGCDQ